jgi:Amt family ammonium transporter
VCKIDDPVGAVSVHGVGGILGTILTGVFVDPSIDGVTDCTILTQTIGALSVGVFAFVAGYAIFYTIDKIHGLRCDKIIEEEGLDIYEHGETAYN